MLYGSFFRLLLFADAERVLRTKAGKGFFCINCEK